MTVSRTTDLLKQRKEALPANPGAVLRALEDSAGCIAALALHATDGKSRAQDCVMRGRNGNMLGWVLSAALHCTGAVHAVAAAARERWESWWEGVGGGREQ